MQVDDSVDSARRRLRAHYVSEQACDGLGHPLPLHHHCIDAEACWERQIPPNDIEWNRIYLPYLGSLCWNDPARLLVAGINANEFGGKPESGGLLAFDNLLLEAQGLLREGKKEVYGSLVFHRVAVYATLLTSACWELDADCALVGGKALDDCSELLAGTLDRIMYTNLIKCSPRGNRSRPTDQMKELCVKRFFLQELEVLQPRTLLVLSTDDRISLGPMQEVSHKQSPCVHFYWKPLRPRAVFVVRIIHPTDTFHGGISPARALDLARALKDVGYQPGFEQPSR